MTSAEIEPVICPICRYVPDRPGIFVGSSARTWFTCPTHGSYWRGTSAQELALALAARDRFEVEP